MKATKYLSNELILKKGLEALVKALGPVEAVRFITMPVEERIESVKRHREWQKKIDKETFFKEVFN